MMCECVVVRNQGVRKWGECGAKGGRKLCESCAKIVRKLCENGATWRQKVVRKKRTKLPQNRSARYRWLSVKNRLSRKLEKMESLAPSENEFHSLLSYTCLHQKPNLKLITLLISPGNYLVRDGRKDD